jgi:hypothetical protein
LIQNYEAGFDLAISEDIMLGVAAIGCTSRLFPKLGICNQ